MTTAERVLVQLAVSLLAAICGSLGAKVALRGRTRTPDDFPGNATLKLSVTMGVFLGAISVAAGCLIWSECNLPQLAAEFLVIAFASAVAAYLTLKAPMLMAKK